MRDTVQNDTHCFLIGVSAAASVGCHFAFEALHFEDDLLVFLAHFLVAGLVGLLGHYFFIELSGSWLRCVAKALIVAFLEVGSSYLVCMVLPEASGLGVSLIFVGAAVLSHAVAEKVVKEH